MNILITGTSGNVGQEVLKQFSPNYEQSVFLATRNAYSTNQNDLFFDFDDLFKTSKSLEGIDIVFLLRPPHISDVDKYFKSLIQIFKEKHIKHIIFLSVQGAEKVSFIPHAKIEQMIIKSHITYTFIRPSYFMQNLTTTLRADIKDKREIFLPSGKGKFLWVDVADIAKVIANILANPTLHQNKAYTITGEDLLDFFEVSHLLSETLNEEVKFINPNLFRFFSQKKREGYAIGYILVLVMLHYLPRFQELPTISPDFEYITKIKATRLRDFIYRNVDLWK